MRIWNISASSDDDFTLLLADVKPWAVFAPFAWDRLCGLTGGRLGGHGPSDWPWKVPLGKPVRDPMDGLLNNSVASRLHDMENWVMFLDSRTGTEVAEVPLTRDQAMQIDPKFTTEWESLDNEDDDA